MDGPVKKTEPDAAGIIGIPPVRFESISCRRPSSSIGSKTEARPPLGNPKLEGQSTKPGEITNLKTQTPNKSQLSRLKSQTEFDSAVMKKALITVESRCFPVWPYYRPAPVIPLTCQERVLKMCVCLSTRKSGFTPLFFSAGVGHER